MQTHRSNQEPVTGWTRADPTRHPHMYPCECAIRPTPRRRKPLGTPDSFESSVFSRHRGRRSVVTWNPLSAHPIPIPSAGYRRAARLYRPCPAAWAPHLWTTRPISAATHDRRLIHLATSCPLVTRRNHRGLPLSNQVSFRSRYPGLHSPANGPRPLDNLFRTQDGPDHDPSTQIRKTTHHTRPLTIGFTRRSSRNTDLSHSHNNRHSQL